MAQALTKIVAAGRWKYASHRLRASSGRPLGTKNVPGPRPPSSRARMSGSAPLAMNTPQPARVASRAALIFEIMPPVAVSLIVPPAMASISGVIFATTGTICFVPLRSTSPGAVERMKRYWARAKLATIAASVSLSPNFSSAWISAALTVSFSLITGMVP